MAAPIGRCRTAIRRFSGFPAVSLPRLRFGRRFASKALIRNGFSILDELGKNFTLSFPERQGRGGGGVSLPSCVPSGLRQPPARRSDGLLMLAATALRKPSLPPLHSV